ncbi:sigma-70 family RNA polymerase sigma factor [Xylophilus sp. GW821-FHT01B05]
MSTPAPLSLLDEFPRQYDALVRFLRNRTGSSDEAREIAHDTWLRLAEPAADGQAPVVPVQDARAYLSTVAAHLLLDRYRRASWLQCHTQDSAASGAMASHVPDVADGLMYRQALAAVEAVLAALPQRARGAFVAHRVHGESQDAIAQRFDVSRNTVERDLILAADRIEAALQRWRGDAPLVQRRGRRRGLASFLALAGVTVGGSLLWRHLSREALRWQASLVARGSSLSQPLPDGSMLALDVKSRIEFAYDAQRRSARLLAGAAFFDVQHDTARPFVVEAAGVTATVLGTRFGVEIEPRGAVLVQVEAGRVRVERPGTTAVVLGVGQGLRVLPDGQVQPANGAAASWRNGVLHFDAVPLGEAVERLARYASFELHTDPRVASLRISGTVETAHLSDWLQSLPAVLRVRVAQEEGGGVRIVAR